MSGLTGSVGSGSANSRNDVMQVQRLLDAQRQAGFPMLKLDGIAGPRTLSAISDFQRRRLGARSVDGLIEPGKRTWSALQHQGSSAGRSAAAAVAATTRAAATASRATSVAESQSPGLYRVERYSVIHNRANPIGSRLAQRRGVLIDTTPMSDSYQEREVPIK